VVGELRLPGHHCTVGPHLGVTPLGASPSPSFVGLVGRTEGRGGGGGDGQGLPWRRLAPSRPLADPWPPCRRFAPGGVGMSFYAGKTLQHPRGGNIRSRSYSFTYFCFRGCAAANANGRGGDGGHEAPDHYESGGALVPRAVGSRDWDRFPVTAPLRPRTRCPPMHTPWPRR
jgi:hypothetical protein